MSHPLSCWDIVVEGITGREEFEKDIKALRSIIKVNNWQFEPKGSLNNYMVWEDKTIIITSPDLKIQLATKNIYEMNGYQPHELIGKSPRIFQGEATTLASRKKISIAVKKQLPFECDIMNYRKDGKLYTCHIEGYPIFNRQGQLVNFIAIENAA